MPVRRLGWPVIASALPWLTLQKWCYILGPHPNPCQPLHETKFCGFSRVKADHTLLSRCFSRRCQGRDVTAMDHRDSIGLSMGKGRTDLPARAASRAGAVSRLG